MAGGYDLIGPKISPRGQLIGLESRAGDAYNGATGSGASQTPFGPVVQAWDPVNLTTRYFRFGIQIQDEGGGVTAAVIIATEIDTEGNIVP